MSLVRAQQGEPTKSRSPIGGLLFVFFPLFRSNQQHPFTVRQRNARPDASRAFGVANVALSQEQQGLIANIAAGDVFNQGVAVVLPWTPLDKNYILWYYNHREAKSHKEGNTYEKSQKVICILLSVCIILCIFPTAIFASDTYLPAEGISSGRVYFVMNVNGGKCLDVSSGNTANGSDVAQYTYTPSCEWQQWRITYCGNGEYKIMDMHSNKLLSISASSSADYANAHIWADDGTAGQYFRIRKNSDGTYTFLSKCSGYTKALGVYQQGTANGATIVQQANDDGSDNQKFAFVNTSVRLYLFASGGKFAFAPNEDGRTDFGHAWIKILNTSDIKITVGYYPYPLNSNKSITVGRFGNVSSSSGSSNDTEFEGIWYNFENAIMKIHGDYLTNTCTYIEISMSQFESISSTTKNINDGYNLWNNNCVDYAVHIWNLVCNPSMSIPDSEVSEVGVSYPLSLEEKIKNDFYHITNTGFTYSTYYGYYKNNQFVTKTY